MSDTHVCGEGLAHLADLPNLEIVVLDGTPISDSDLPYLRQVPPTASVYLRNTRMTNAVFRQLPNATGAAIQSPGSPAPVVISTASSEFVPDDTQQP
jgi:hypothetical protein